MEDLQLTLKNMKTYYLVSAISNGVGVLLWGTYGILFGLATCGIGCLFLVLPIINLTVMILDIMAMGKVEQAPTPQAYSFLKFTAIADIVACFILVPLIMGILNLQNLGKPEVYAYFNPEPGAAPPPQPPVPPQEGTGA